jgi:hypothetical protein
VADEIPLFDRITDAIVEAVEAALDGRNPNLPPLDAPDPAAARQDLNQLHSRAQAITAATDPGQWASAIGNWAGTVSTLAGHAFGPGRGNALLVRVLQERAPRTSTALGLAGVIASPTPGRVEADYVRLRSLVNDPGSVVDDARWRRVLGSPPAAAMAGLTGANDESSIVATLWMLGLLTETMLALALDLLTVAPIERPIPDPGPWADFRAKSAEWVSVTIVTADPAKPADQRSPKDPLDLPADLEPNLSATIAMRSYPRTVGGKAVTGFELWWLLSEDRDRWEYDLGSGWRLRVEPGITAGLGYDGSWHGAFRPVSPAHRPPGAKDPVVVSLGRDQSGDAPDIVIGPPGDTRIVAKDVGLFLRVREQHPVFELGGFVHGFSVVLTNRWWRTFGASQNTLRDGLRFDLDLDITRVEGKGLLLNLDTGLDVMFHLDWQVFSTGTPGNPFGLKIHSIRVHLAVAATQADFNIRAEVRFHASIQMGPLLLVLDGPGAWVGYWTDGTPPSKHYLGGLAPTGVGAEITLPMVTGGGFLDFTGGPNERFGGLLHLKVGPVEVVAFGLHELIGPPEQANRKTSLIMVIGIQFSPGIQLGFGLSLTGVGGLVGINRRADTDALREKLTSGAAGNLLFAEDPVKNAPSLLGDLGAVFPPASGVFVVGPTLQIRWLQVAGKDLARLDVGVFLELPGPTKLILLGSLRARLPGGMLNIRLDLLGVIDFQKKLIEIDATLINSEALLVFTLTGDAALRASYGQHPYMMLSLGGFHPHFKPEPAVFPELARIALTMQKSTSKQKSTSLFLRVEAYIAVTTNSIQFGGAIEAGAYLGPLNAVGFIRLDVLFQFSPFYFEVTLAAGFRIRFGETTLLGVRVEGVLAGPGPITLSASFVIEILFFEIPFSGTFVIGDSGPEEIVNPVGSAAQELQSELTEPKNLEATGGGDREASVRPGSAPRALVSPLGGLKWTQQRAPLNLLIDRFDGQPLAAPQSLTVEASNATGSARDWFSAASFATLSKSEELNRPSFERLDAGLALGFGDDASGTVPHSPTVIEVRIPAAPAPGTAFDFPAVILAAMLGRTGVAAVRTTAPRITVTDEQFVVRGRDGSVTHAARSRSDAHQRARRTGGLALPPDDLVELEV